MMMLNWWRLWRRWCWYWWWWLTLWFSHRWWQWWWWFSQFCAIGAKPNQRVRLDNRLIGNFASGLRPSSWGSILWGDKVNFFANKLTQGNTFTNRLSQQSINFQADKVRFWLQKIIPGRNGRRRRRMTSLFTCIKVPVRSIQSFNVYNSPQWGQLRDGYWRTFEELLDF